MNWSWTNPFSTLEKNDFGDAEILKKKLTHLVTLLLLVFLFPIIVMISIRAFKESVWTVSLIQVMVYGVIAALYYFRQKISYQPMAKILIGSYTIGILIGIYTWGIIGTAFVSYITAVCCTTVILGWRQGLKYAIAVCGICFCIGYLHWSGLLGYSVEISEYANSPSAWVFKILASLALSLILIFAFAWITESLENSIQELETQNRKIIQFNQTLLEEIDKRKQTEAHLEDARKNAEAASKAKSDFLSVMSHELRTPLNPILGFSELLSHENLGETSKLHLEQITDAGTHLLTLIDNILDFSRIDREEIRLQLMPFKISKLVGDIIQVMKHQAEKKGLILKLSLDRQLIEEENNQCRRNIDPIRMRQILLNLISNAIKFTSEGSIQINVTHKDALQFEIKDSGRGIDKEDIERIFQPFTQVNNRLNRSFEGVGLGLTITHKIVDAMGGKIEVDSERDKGTTVHVSIPAELVQKTSALSEIGQHPWEGSKKTVLIVEDMESNRNLAISYLSGKGIQIYTANNGTEALQILNERKVDLILMDVRMPVMDGFEATRHIRKEDKTNLIPIIAVTAQASYASRSACLDSGMNDYLRKPISKNELLESLDRWL